jgi:hypothetical protein
MLVFAFVETLNMLELYFMRDKSVFNGVSIFKGWEKSKTDPEVYEFVQYLINWLAGVKLIVLALVVILVFTASERTLILSAIVLVIAVASFYWRLYPMIRKMDNGGNIQPGGRSRQLGLMVACLEFVFIVAIVMK